MMSEHWSSERATPKPLSGEASSHDEWVTPRKTTHIFRICFIYTVSLNESLLGRNLRQNNGNMEKKQLVKKWLCWQKQSLCGFVLSESLFHTKKRRNISISARKKSVLQGWLIASMLWPWILQLPEMQPPKNQTNHFGGWNLDTRTGGSGRIFFLDLLILAHSSDSSPMGRLIAGVSG